MPDKILAEKLRSFVSRHKSEAYALSGWLKLKNKPFGVYDALEAVYNAAGGKENAMLDILTQMTKKSRVYGRTQVYGSYNGMAGVDILRKPDGSLYVSGWNGVPQEPERNSEPPSKRNPDIFKANSQVRKNYQNTEMSFTEAGDRLREMYPDDSKEELYQKLKALYLFTRRRKKGYDYVLDAIRDGRAVFEEEHGIYRVMFVSPVRTEGKRVLFNDRFILLAEAVEEEMTFYKFLSNVKSFLRNLLTDPVNAKPSVELLAKGLNRSRLINQLANSGIIVKDEKITDRDDDGNPVKASMTVKYKVPKRDFERNVQKLFIRLFEKNLPVKKETVECGDGATSADASGQYSQPVFPMQRREMPANEATTTFNAGDYQYEVPFPGDKETLLRKKGGSIAMERER